jgi:hypothetical protein
LALIYNCIQFFDSKATINVSGRSGFSFGSHLAFAKIAFGVLSDRIWFLSRPHLVSPTIARRVPPRQVMLGATILIRTMPLRICI